MFYAISLGLVMFGLWLLLSGYFVPLLLSLGVASCALVVFIAWRMDVIDKEAIPVQLLRFGIFGYLMWLAKEIAKSNLAVTKLILSPSLPISPRMIRVKATQKSDFGLAIHANSITLTPGTVSVAVTPGEILVHAITREAAEGTLEGSIDRRVTAIEDV